MEIIDLKNIDFFIVCDLETTGTDVHLVDWITGSFSKIDKRTFKTLSELDLKSRPSNHWCEDARRTHRIPYHEAIEYPERKESLQKLIDWLPPRGTFAFVCHANPNPFINGNDFKMGKHFCHFDLGVLKWDFALQDRIFDFYRLFDEQKVISTRKIALEFFGQDKALNLAEICANLGIKMDGSHHDARADRLACEKILRKYIHESGSQFFGIRDSKLDFAISEIQENCSMEEQQRFGL